MKRTLLVFFFQWLGPLLWAQTIEWAKSFGLAGQGSPYEYIDQIVQLEDGSYRALARISRFGKASHNGDWYDGLALVGLSSLGDTLFVRNMNVTANSGSKSLSKSNDGYLLIALSVGVDTVLGSEMRVYKTDNSGNVVWMYPFIGVAWDWSFANKVIQSREGGAYLIGQAKSIFPGFFRDGFLAKINAAGQLDFSFRYADLESTSLNNIEEMKDGNYLLSGSAGNRIWSCVVDSTGFQLSDKTWFKGGAGEEAQIKQGHGSENFYGFGRHSNGNTSIIKYNQNGDSVWVKRQTLAGFAPFISSDGGYVRYEGYTGGRLYLRKYKPDSTLEWSTFIVDLSQNNIGLNCMAFDGLGSAVLAGDIQPSPNSNNRDMYFMKVTNVGYPVDPLSTRPKVETQFAKGPELLAYPNPTQSNFYLQGIKTKTNVALYNLQGQMLLHYRLSPNEAFPARRLQPGIYVWKAEDGKKVWSGKIVKE